VFGASRVAGPPAAKADASPDAPMRAGSWLCLANSRRPPQRDRAFCGELAPVGSGREHAPTTVIVPEEKQRARSGW
jgi:hypothetical protein